MIKILKYGQVQKDDIFARTEPTVNVEAIVTEIIAQVRAKGDEALYAYCEKFDGVKLSALQVTQEEIDEAFSLVEPRFIEVLTKAAENIDKPDHIPVIGDAQVAPDLILFNVGRVDGDDQFHLVLHVQQHPQFTVGLEAGQYTGCVVVVI